MWSTLREEQSLADCCREFSYLRARGLADHFFWHWVETPDPFVDFAAYARRYEIDLVRIMEIYIAELAEGRIFPVIHINELIVYLLTGRDRGSTACGVELERNFDLLDGKIHACADLPLDMHIGTIDPSGAPVFRDHDLDALIGYKEGLGCARCGVHPYCGGRCPVQAYFSGRERLIQYCLLMRLHVGTVKRYMGDIRRLMRGAGITAQDLYDQSAYLAPYTDVTP